MSDKRTIRITGTGDLRLRPDTTRITMTLEGREGEYAGAVALSAADTEKLKTALAALGFRREEVKTTRFDVDAEYESYKEHGAYRQRLTGYRYSHALYVEFPSDRERLGKVLAVLASCEARPVFRISYTVRDAEGAKNALLEKAVADAGEKARALTRAAGVTLGEVQSIDYSWSRLDLEVMPVAPIGADMCMKSSVNSLDLDVEPDDILLSDTVTVLWAIG